jgi:endonuclease/exonuclease/phosphatase family metal-dependent hydrolase
MPLRPSIRPVRILRIVSTTPDALTVMTLNLWNTNRWEERRDAVVQWINEVEPDLLALQEVMRTPADSQAQWIAERTSMVAVFGPAHGGDGSQFGNAVLSTFPVVDSQVSQLTDAGSGGEPRCLLNVHVDSPGGVISFSSTHLAYRFDEGWVREAQVVQLAELIEVSGASYPPILCGDFNARPDAAEVRFLKGLTSLAGRSFHMFDAHEVANYGDAGFTWDNRNPYAATNHVPDQRIDYVLVGVRGSDGAGRILSTRLVCDEPRHGAWASDHFGVCTTLSWPTRSSELE